MTSDPRRVAHQAVMRVTDHGGYSNLTLPGALRRADLSREDAALATELTYGTIRRMRSLDWAIERFSSRPLRRMTANARAALRLGAYQILFTRIPAHAAVSRSVGLAGASERGFVNAVLRKLSAAPFTWPQGDTDGEISIRTGLAEWAVAELRTQVGSGVDGAAAALGAKPSLCLRANRCRIAPEDLAKAFREAGVASMPGTVHPDTIVLEGGDPTRLPGFSEGWFAVQDQASAFVVGAMQLDPGMRALDLCAGPGGKTAHIACSVQPGGLCVASDVHPRRTGLVARTTARLGVKAGLLVQDAASPALKGSFDRVLVDAPCSGIGSARRRPELLWRGDPADLGPLSALQLQIAVAGADQLATGGRLIYSVCTFPGEETDSVCDALLESRPFLRPAPVQGPDGASDRVRLWPHLHGSDAMFVAAFTRTS